MIGRSIGNYKIVRVLGEGGMGTVYLAEHPMIGKRVAVKMLRPDLGTDPGLVSRFFQEARAVNEIRHPNIVDISDFGHTEDGVVYFVMELMEGRSLREHLTAGGRMPLDEVVSISRQVCDALAAAHRVGIIHRDLKPDNIFLVKDQSVPGAVRAKLFDFGVAKLLGQQEKQVGHKTMAGSVVGTPFYMSPEQSLCQDVTAASDIYSMGVVMFEMVTGTVPFHAEQLVILLNAILKQPAPPASRMRPEVPSWLDRLLLRCLEKDPDARPRTMEELIAVLASGAVELGGGMEPALMATMAAAMARPSQITPRPVVVPPTTGVSRATMSRTRTGEVPVIATSAGVSRATMSRTRTGEVPVTGMRPSAVREAAQGAAQEAPAQDAAATSMAVGPRLAVRPGSESLLDKARIWLNSPRVRRLALPAAIGGAIVIVGSVFISSAADEPVKATTEIEVPAEPVPTKVLVNLSSEPQGAEVTRINDGRLLGTTPLVDIRTADGQQLNYRFHLAGYTDVQVPVQGTPGAKYEITATLVPVEVKPEPVRSAPSSRRTNKKSSRAAAAPAPTRTVAAPAAPKVAPRREDISQIPPLLPSVRVRRIGGR